MVKVERHTQVAPQAVFLDGLTGTGKTMMGAILSTFERVEVQRFEHIYEHVCSLWYLGRIEEDAAVQLIQMYIDLSCYNGMIGRESNFRWKDLTGVLSNPGGWRYIRRLFQPDGDAVIQRINSQRPIPQIISHQLMGISGPLFTALGERLSIVEMVRHPLYLLEHWHSYIGRHGTDPRDFTVWLYHNGSHLPWFTLGWEDRYLDSNNMDRVIYSIDCLTRLADDNREVLSEDNRQRVPVVPFERFVIDPDPYLHRIGECLGSRTSNRTRKTLRKQKVPRRVTTAGKDSEVYRRYDWQPPSPNSDEAAELQKRWDFAASEATPEGMDILEKMCRAYEDKYLKQSATV